VKLTLICVGNKFDAHEEAWISNYLLRMKKFANVSLVKIKDTQNKETWAHILKAVPEKSHLILLDQKGKSHTTEQLSAWFEQTLLQRSSLTFVVGGSFGFDDEQRKMAHHLLALSAMTLPHRIALLVLAEQLYRVLTMKAGHPYHHTD